MHARWYHLFCAGCVLFCFLMTAGCAGHAGRSEASLALVAQELASGVAVAPIPGTGVLSYDCEEREVPPRIQRVASVRYDHGADTGYGTEQEPAGVVAEADVQRQATADVPVPLGNVSSNTPATRTQSPFRTSCPPALWQNLAREAQDIFGVDAGLILAVIRAESSFNPEVVSSAGAEGAMQIMPGTQEELGLIDPFDPRANVYAGTQYLMEQLQRFGSVELALAAYNAGPSSVERYGGVPPFPETQEYVRKVLDYWAAGRQKP